jgi:uncharacterized repeat protein (TIGR02543 family)
MTIRINSGNNDGFEGSLGDKDLKEGDTFSFKSDNPIEIFLYAMQTKGARICDNVEITSGGEVYLNDGSAMSSIIKETELVFGKFVDGVFQPLNPTDKFVNSLNSGTQDLVLNPVSDSMYGGDTLTLSEGIQVTGTASDGKWYLRLTRPNGSILYKEMKGINDMFDSTMDDRINSIPEVLKQLHDLGVAVKTVMDQNQFSRMQDVDNLENNTFDTFISTYKQELNDKQGALSGAASAADLALYSEMIGNVENAKLSIQGTFDYNHGAASVTFASLLNNNTVTAIFELGNGENTLRPSIIDPDRHDIKNWLVKAVVHDPDDGMIINDSIWHKAYIENGQIKVDVRAVDCQELVAGRTVEVTVTYAGSMAAIDSTTATMVEVSFNTDGGSSLSAIDFVFGKSYGELPVPLKEGHSFEGWYTQPNGAGELVSSSSYVTSSSSVTLYAKWSASASYVTAFLDYEGSYNTLLLPSELQLSSGDVYPTLPEPTRGGYTFDGWYTGDVNNKVRNTNNTYSTDLSSLNFRRQKHVSTKLANGKVLITGGFHGGQYNSSNPYYECEIYDSATDLISLTDSMSYPRQTHTLTLLPNGKVLAVGGSAGANPAISTNYLNSCELYDPNSGTWTAAASLNIKRYGHIAILLNTGKVLIAGGFGTTGFLNSCELYDPEFDTWSMTGSLAVGRNVTSATLLQNGEVLISGGYNVTSLSSCELYNPLDGVWSSTTGQLNTSRYRHTSTLISSGPNAGKVLVIGGGNSSSGHTNTCELYDPIAKTWSYTGAIAGFRWDHTANILPDGNIILIGGSNSTIAYSSYQIYNSDIGTWSTEITRASSSEWPTAKTVHTATSLDNGDIFICGGCTTTSSTSVIANYEVYDYSASSFIRKSDNGPILNAGYPSWVTLTSGPNTGKLLFIGGTSTASSLCYLYDVETHEWTQVASLNLARHRHNAIVITSGANTGKVLVIGGADNNSTCELYDPMTGLWSYTGALSTSISNGSSIVLPNGKIMTIGLTSASAQLYDPEVGTWSDTGTLAFTYYHINPPIKLYLLSTGKVMAIGISSSYNLRCQLYDISSNSWSITNHPTSTTGSYDADYSQNIQLSDGNILTVGSYSASQGSVNQIYNALTETWNRNIGFNLAISNATYKSLYLLPNGNVLVLSNGSGSYLYTPYIGFSVITNPINSGRIFVPVPIGQEQEKLMLLGSRREIYNFLPLSEKIIPQSTTVESTDNFFLYAHFIGNTYTVTYDVQGGFACSPTTKTVTYGSSYGTLCTPTKSGYIFDGWYTGAGKTGVLVTSSSIYNIIGNQTLYAAWLPSFIIGTGTTSNMSNEYPAPYSNNFRSTRQQYFIRASELSSAGFSSGKTITSIGFNVITNNLSITFNNFQLKIYATTNSNPISTGWVSTGLVAISTTQNITTNLGWNQHEITPYIWDGSSNLVVQVCFSNSNFINNGNEGTQWTTTLSGATFSRWHRTDITTGICSNDTTTNTSITTRPNMKFIYSTNSNFYTVTYDVQGGGPCSPTTRIITSGAIYGTLCTPTKSGYIFDGWYTQPNGAGTLITEDTVVNSDSDHTLYAKWLSSYIIGTGTTSNATTTYPAPYSNYMSRTRQQYFIRASELSGAGLSNGKTITSIGFNVVANNMTFTFGNFQLKIYATTSPSPISAGWVSTGLVASTTTANITTNFGWNQHTLTTPYTWDGSSNLIVEICSNNNSNTPYNNEGTQWTNGLSGTTVSRWVASDTIGSPCTATTTTNTSTTTRPNMRFITSN